MLPIHIDNRTFESALMIILMATSTINNTISHILFLFFLISFYMQLYQPFSKYGSCAPQQLKTEPLWSVQNTGPSKSISAPFPFLLIYHSLILVDGIILTYMNYIGLPVLVPIVNLHYWYLYNQQNYLLFSWQHTANVYISSPYQRCHKNSYL